MESSPTATCGASFNRRGLQPRHGRRPGQPHPENHRPGRTGHDGRRLDGTFSITALVVIEPPNRLAGVIHLHDLLKHGIV